MTDMQAYYRHIETCNTPVEEPLVPWRLDGHLVGLLRPAFIEHLRRHDGVFTFDASAVGLHADLQGFAQRSASLQTVTDDLAERGVTPPVMGEPYAVTPGGREQALCVVDRAAAAHFGLRSFGQHLNGFVRKADGLHMWLGRRARDRLLFPGALDNMVAGGLPHDLSLAENLVKECAEEAGVPEALARRAVPVGVVSYSRVAKRGLRRDLLYCYDLELPGDFVPRNTDGEVESFELLHIEDVAKIVRDTDEFKLNCNLVVIDFLVRHGILDPSQSGYLELVVGLRQPM